MNFEMVGKLVPARDTEKFKAYTDTVYDSGWENKTLNFSVVAGDNRHFMRVQGGTWSASSGKKGTVYSFTKPADGKTKGESIQIPWADRTKKSVIDKIAEFRKFIFDLEVPGRRADIERLIRKNNNGEAITDEELKKIGINSPNELEDALKVSLSKKHEYLTEWDFVDFIKKVLDSGKYSDKNFFIRGSKTYSYNPNNGNVYENLVPSRIYLAADDAEPYSTGTVTMVIGKDSIDDSKVEDEFKYVVTGHEFVYESSLKKNIPVEVTVVIPIEKFDDEKEQAKEFKKKEKIVNKVFRVDDDNFYEVGCNVDMLNGSQRTRLTLDDLTEDEREDIELGLATLEDFARDRGGDVYGDMISEYRFIKYSRGYSSGRKDTSYTEDDFKIVNPADEADEMMDELFDDDDI